MRLQHLNPSTLMLLLLLSSLIAFVQWGPLKDLAREGLPGGPPGVYDEGRMAQWHEEKRCVVLACIEARAAVARELARGELTLFEAASKIREIDRRNPHFCWEAFRMLIPGACDDERHCRAVITCLQRWLPEGSETESLVVRYLAELEAHLKRGPVRLPDQNAADDSE